MREQTNGDPGALAGATGAECKAERLRPDASTAAPAVKAFPAQAAWRERNPLKVWAHAALRSALNRGIIEKQPCEVCGAEDSEAHHFSSYQEPLTVRWLCRKHHKATHAAEKAA